ncbi:hypothetical protein BGX28_003172 [Mortierella sp. GBA30]|nr:hypothetical protein BGX28_003172 [Mortierella sp. GBA30]
MEDNVPGNSIDSVVDRADLTAISQIQDISSSDQATECLLSKEITSGPTPTKPSSAATAAISSPSSIVPKVAKPEWATGDPFFDTMAGMDNSLEYKRYYGGLEQTSGTSSSSHGLADHTASMAISDISVQNDTLAAGSASASSSSSSAYTNTGLDHWNRTREQWTKGQWHVVRSANSNNPALSAIHPKNHDAIYDSLIYDRKRLSKPIPLPLVVGALSMEQLPLAGME